MADDCAVLAERMRRDGGARRLRDGGRHDGDDLAFVGEIERIEAEDFAKSLHLVAHGCPVLLDLDADAGGLGDLVEHRREPAARRVAHELDLRACVEQCIDERS